MRLWSLHPQYLDRQGLLACWREALLAQKVLQGQTIGYTHHPQLQRFQEQPDPLAAIGAYLASLADEAERRGYRFDQSKIVRPGDCPLISVTREQLEYEWQHLLRKLQQRSPADFERNRAIDLPEPHPLFRLIDGPVEAWEKI